MSSNTPRFVMPNIMVSQAHKEITHNEALACIDVLLHASIAGVATSPPAVTEADAGKCWLIAATASGAWLGREDSIASWNGSSWRFFSPVPGLTVWNSLTGCELRFTGGAWLQPATVPDPNGGAFVDVEARAAISALLAHLRSSGLLVT